MTFVPSDNESLARLSEALGERDFVRWFWHEEWYEPKGNDMARQVKLTVGEGDKKVEIGEAHVEQMQSGDMAVLLKITDPAVIKALGSDTLRGVIPKTVEIPPALEEDTNE